MLRPMWRLFNIRCVVFHFFPEWQNTTAASVRDLEIRNNTIFLLTRYRTPWTNIHSKRICLYVKSNDNSNSTVGTIRSLASDMDPLIGHVNATGLATLCVGALSLQATLSITAEAEASQGPSVRQRHQSQVKHLPPGAF